MKEKFWRWLATMLAASPRIRRLLVDLAKRTPYLPIHGSDGSLYMERFWLIKERTWLPFSIRIHVIHRPDSDRHPHDHPWDFRTLILEGSYVEWLVPLGVRPTKPAVVRKHLGRTRWLTNTLKAGDTATRTRGQYHLIAKVEGPVTTMVILGKRHGSWGFLVWGKHWDWKRYLRAFQ